MSRSTRVGGVFATALYIIFVALSAGCGSPEEGGVEGPSVDSGAEDDGLLEDDGGIGEDSSPEDVGPGDTGVVDAAPQDTGPEDTGPEDPGPVDAGPKDVGKPDIGKPDIGKPDSGPTDTKGALCAGYVNKFKTSADAARKCKTSFSCTDLAAAGVGCKACEVFYSHDTPGLVQAVHDVSSESTQKKCDPACPKLCVDPTKHVGVCGGDGTCTFDAPSCQDMEKRFALVAAAAHKCKVDTDCAFQAQVGLPCGCGEYLNIKTMGPGKPLFRYAKMLVMVYNQQKCFSGACACPEFNKAKCVSGMCVSLK
jgi:hypothetical protein